MFQRLLTKIALKRFIFCIHWLILCKVLKQTYIYSKVLSQILHLMASFCHELIRWGLYKSIYVLDIKYDYNGKWLFSFHWQICLSKFPCCEHEKNNWKKKYCWVQDNMTLLNQRDATHHPMLLTIEATGAKGHLISKSRLEQNTPTKKFENFCPRIWKVVKSTK